MSLMTRPSAIYMFLQIAFCIIVEEVLFYYSHRMLHHPRFYAKVHKIHHEFKV